MAWVQITVATKAHYARQLGDILSANKAIAVTYRDAKDSPIFEPPPGEITLWQDTLVTGLYTAETDMKQVVHQLEKVRFLSNPLQYKLDGLEDKEWELAWMDNFKPICFADAFWIVPSWHEVPQPEQAHLVLDPGMAFGTGTHPTTSLCLTWLAQHPLQGLELLDFGCGSGILGLAGLTLGAQHAHFVDIDQQALKATLENAEKNKLNAQCSVYASHHYQGKEHDLVVANILASPLIELAPLLMASLAHQGHLVLSGLLKRQAEQVMAAYRPWIEFDEPVVLEDWCLLVGQKIS